MTPKGGAYQEPEARASMKCENLPLANLFLMNSLRSSVRDRLQRSSPQPGVLVLRAGDLPYMRSRLMPRLLPDQISGVFPVFSVG